VEGFVVIGRKKLLLASAIMLAGILSLGGIFMLTGGKSVVVNEDRREENTFKNPLSITDIGDPFVLKASDGKYYMYATSAPRGYYVWSSENMLDWEKLGYAYQADPDSWGIKDFWAPEVVEYKGKYYMYYSARWKENNSLRVGVAVSDEPQGPFADVQNKPMFDLGYAAIDANVIVDEDGRKYMYYSRDCSENIVSGRHESHIYGVELNEDMLSIKSEPKLLTKPEQEWELQSGREWRWNEGPSVFKKNGNYYMMYSGNFYGDKKYGIGYAVSKSPLGPFVKYEGNPIVSYVESKDEILVSGPGHNSLTVSPDGKDYYVVYHSHTEPAIGGGNRQICIDKLGFRADGTIFVNGPTIASQPLPSGLSKDRNIALEANVAVSSSMEGYSAKGINDGEIGVSVQSERFDWVTNNKAGEYVKLEWDKPRKINKIFIYGSTKAEREVFSVTLKFDDKDYIKNIEIPIQPGKAEILSFDEREAQSIKLVIEKGSETSKEAALSEIIVMGE
jgi:GH43 family beta-xylosidase